MKVALVSGTRKGLGRAIAEHLLAHDWQVAGCSRTGCGPEHERYRHFNLDVGDEAAVVKMFRSVKREWGGLDALVNNAAIASMNHLMVTPGRTARALLETNVLGTFFLLREASKIMSRKKYGRIVNFSTVAVPLALEGEALYAASKAAIESLTRVAAQEFGSMGVTVNAVGPTPIATDLIKTVPKSKIEDLVQRQAIKRLGEPRDVLNVLDFFLAPESEFITAQVVYLGGVHG